MPSLTSSILSLAAGAATLLAVASGASAQRSHVHGLAPEVIAITGGRIITVSGADIPDGAIVVRNGKITAIGPASEIELPYDAIEIELEPGMVVMPGMFHPGANDGLAGPNESFPITPFLDIRDAIDPASLFFESMLRAGVTSVHVMPTDNAVIGGLSAVVRPIGMTMGDMDLKGEIALKFTVSSTRGGDRMSQLASHREVFAAHADYVNKLAGERYAKERQKDDKPVDLPPEEARERGMKLLEDRDYDERNRNIMRLLRGDFGAWFVCLRAMDIAPALSLAEAQGMTDRSVLMVGTEAYKAVDAIAASGRPVVLSEQLFHRERDVMTGDLREVFVPKVFADKGVPFALQPSPSGSFAERYPTYQVAQCIRNGVARDVAFKAVTLYPAQMLGLDEQLGSLEVGKVGNLVIFTGDPLDFSSEVAHVYIEGVHAYDRSKDQRLQDLLRVRDGFEALSDKEAKPADKAADKPATPAADAAPAPAAAPAGAPTGAPAGAPGARPVRPSGEGDRPSPRQRRGN